MPLSKLRRVGDTYYLAGDLGLAEDGSIPAGIEEQTRNCLNRIGATLAAEGLNHSNIVSCLCHLSDAADFQGFNAAYAEFFADPMPVRTTVQSALMIDAKVEITVVAVA